MADRLEHAVGRLGVAVVHDGCPFDAERASARTAALQHRAQAAASIACSSAAMRSRSVSASTRRSSSPDRLGRQEAHVDDEAAGPADLHQALAQRRVADVLRRDAHRLARLAVAQHHRLHDGGRGDGGLQQVGVERQHAVAGAGGAFGEHGDGVGLAQRVGHLVHHAQRVALALALDEQRAAGARQPAQQRPVRDVGLGHEARLRRARVQRGDVQPRHVVGHHQHRARLRACPTRAPARPGSAASARSSAARSRGGRRHRGAASPGPPATARAATMPMTHRMRQRATSVLKRRRRVRGGAVGQRAGDERVAHAARHARAAGRGVERRVLAAAAQRLGRDLPFGVRVEHADVGHAAFDEPARALAQRAERLAQHAHGLARHARERLRERQLRLRCPTSAPGSAAARGRWRRARPRRTAASCRRRRSACGRTPARRSCRRPGRRAARRDPCPGAAAASGACRR